MKIIKTCSVLLIILLFTTPALSKTDEASRKARELTLRAAEHMNNKEYNKAIPLLEKAIEVNPEDPDALRYISIYNQQIIEPLCRSAADAYFKGKYTRAIDNWQKIINYSASESQRIQPLIDYALIKARKQELEVRYQAVNRLMDQERFIHAAEELEAIIESFPGEQKARAMLAKLSGSLSTNVIREHYLQAQKLMDAENYADAIKKLQAVLELDPKQELAKKLIIRATRLKYKNLYSKAEQQLASGQLLMAQETYTEVLKNNPTDTTIASTLTRLDEAIKITPVIEGKTNLERVLSVSIYNYVSPDGDPKSSVAAAWYATQLAPFNSLAQTIREFIESKNSRAIRLLDPPVKEMNLVEQYLFAALNHIYEGRYDLTVEECGIVLKLNPGNMLALKRMGSAYYMMGKKEKADKVWREALNISPKDQELKEFLELLE